MKTKAKPEAATSGRTVAKRPVAAKRPAPNAERATRAEAQHTFVRDGQTFVVVGRSVFEDLGFGRKRSRELVEEAFDEVLEQKRNSVKSRLVDVARDEILSMGLNTTQAAEYLSMTRPRVSDILNRKFEKVSIDAIVDVVHKFGKEVRVEIVDRATASSGRKAGARAAAKP